MSNSSVCSILDIPDEILVMIILHFNAKERLALANSCKKFNDLVFGDKELLRNLDFNRRWPHTKESDIKQYFNDENTYKKILRINIEYFGLTHSSSSISKAINLVELNILRSMKFKSVEELSCFLKPLVHLKRLSFSWPHSSQRVRYDIRNWKQLLKEPFSRLTYLLSEIDYYTNKFPFILQLCQQLKELHLFVLTYKHTYIRPSRQEVMKLSNLKFVRLSGNANWGLLREDIMRIVPNHAEWTDYTLVGAHYGIYLERNVEICAELSQLKEITLPQNVELLRGTGLIYKGWHLDSGHLLSEVIRITHEDAPETFCCFSGPRHFESQLWQLKIDEAKKLLKDPGYQISYLRFWHPIHKNCDAHLLASAFPELTKLVLSRIGKSNFRLTQDQATPLYRRLRKIGSLASKEDSDARNADSSFKMLVKNTPRLKVLKIFPVYRDTIYVEDWDLDALYLISGWKNLTVISLRHMPITDGRFLIDIGKECTQLEEVTLNDLNPDESSSFESELLQMLQHCKNLRKLTIEDMTLELLSEMFNILSNCPRLTALCLEIYLTKDCDSFELTSSVEKMFRQCEELNKFLVDGLPDQTDNEITLAVKRIISELNRSGLVYDSDQPDSDLVSDSDQSDFDLSSDSD